MPPYTCEESRGALHMTVIEGVSMCWVQAASILVAIVGRVRHASLVHASRPFACTLSNINHKLSLTVYMHVRLIAHVHVFSYPFSFSFLLSQMFRLSSPDVDHGEALARAQARDVAIKTMAPPGFGFNADGATRCWTSNRLCRTLGVRGMSPTELRVLSMMRPSARGCGCDSLPFPSCLPLFASFYGFPPVVSLLLASLFFLPFFPSFPFPPSLPPSLPPALPPSSSAPLRNSPARCPSRGRRPDRTGRRERVIPGRRQRSAVQRLVASPSGGGREGGC
ncbi:hypothetical protein Naga_101366g2 [Nannochloropsis gaditana]|uniref:Uncharacterized protein n=1 Tax=Nannochloropsis gaditana TaxID=72520 RepID=W7TA13_9STRA|nr:hypothetical protein Naga_101366g2 [Nannochloropsis gaditana]